MFALLAILSSLTAIIFKDFVPDDLVKLSGGNAVEDILKVMASSMLLVVTFALSAMVAAYNSATQVATPRATTLIKDDSKTLSAISIFLGAFIYAIVSLIALSTNYYGKEGRAILLLITVLVLTSVVVVIIRWVEHLKNMISVHETIKSVEKAATMALLERLSNPNFGCKHFAELPSGLKVITFNQIGFIQNIDISSLNDLCKKFMIELYIVKDIGSFVHHKTVLGHVKCNEKMLSEHGEKAIHQAFTIDSNRTFESDPIYGVSVLSGIGQKAMSPSLNDVGTAMDVISTLVRILMQWNRQSCQVNESDRSFDRIFFPEFKVNELIYAAFYNLGKESIRSVEVTQVLSRGLEMLKNNGSTEFTDGINHQLRILLRRFKSENNFDPDIDLVTFSFRDES